MLFDIVSIHESREGDYSYIDNAPKGSFYQAERLTAQMLIMGAYNLQFLQLPELPGWAKEKRFSLTAKSDDTTDQALAKLSDKDAAAEKQHMLQAMLADRFHLRIHPETRVSSVYNLIATPRVAKRMTPVMTESGETWSSCTPRFAEGIIDIESKGCPMSALIMLLQADTSDQIIDRTGMTGHYAFRLYWRWAAQKPEIAAQYPEKVDAVREQLGLELKSGKGPVTFYVVDHIEEPSPN